MEQFLPQESGPGHASIEVIWLLLHNQPLGGLKRLQRLSSRQSQSLLLEAGLLDVLTGSERSLGECSLEHVSGPLKSVLNSVGEILNKEKHVGVVK